MAWATTTDLQDYAPDIIDYGITDWSADIARAEASVLEWVKSNWWYDQVRRYGMTPATWPMDVNLLNTDLLKAPTCFRALGWEILPKLAKHSDPDGDGFSRRAEWFRQRYHDTLNEIGKQSLYDWNKDGTFQDYERRGPAPRVVVKRA